MGENMVLVKSKCAIKMGLFLNKSSILQIVNVYASVSGKILIDEPIQN